MAKKFGFFNSINGDRKYLASDISQAFDIGITTGIKAEEENLQVVPHEGMQVQIQPGSAMIFGHFYMNDEAETITIDTADAELNRIDRVVVRYDAYTREVNTTVIKGSPALSPTPPARLETPEQFDLVLADIYVPVAATVINESNITDMRESELCGYIGVKGAVPQLDFESHLAENISQGGAHGLIYEEGTWTPHLLIGGVSADATYREQNGYYIRIGNIVHCQAEVFLDNKGTSTGLVYLAGLPFSVKIPSKHSLDSFGFFNISDNDVRALSLDLDSTEVTHGSIRAYRFNSSSVHMNNTNLTDKTSFSINFTYLI